MITSRQLEVFLAVYREQNMTRAGKRLNMTQSAVSQTVKEIEGEYETKLFERSGNRIFPTQAGEILYGYGKRIESLYKEMDAALATNGGISRIRVGANISAGTGQIREFIKKYEKIHPDIEVCVKVFNHTVLEKALEAHELDFCLMEDLVQPESLDQYVTIPYYKDRILVVGRGDHPLLAKDKVYLKDLENEKVMFRESGAGVRQKFEHLLELNGVHIRPVWECISTEGIVNAIKEGFGISVLPYLLVKKHLEEGSLVEIPICDAALSRNLNVVYHKDKVLSRPMQDFIDIVLETKEV